MQSIDLKYRYIYSKTAKDLSGTAGISNCLEPAIVFAIYEAAVGKSYTSGWSVQHEMPYPSDGGNPKRSDLAFKLSGPGTNWAHVEVKKYDYNGKRKISDDIDKLKLLNRVQRWILTYRIISENSGKYRLSDLLASFDGNDDNKRKLEVVDSREFRTLTEDGDDGICDICLARVK